MKLKRCSRCKTTDQSRMDPKSDSTICFDCRRADTKAGGQVKQTQNNKQILKGLKP